MEAGRELDALIAEKVMGLTRHDEYPFADHQECLEAFNVATRERDRWYGVHLAPGNKYFKEQEPYNPS